MRTAEDFYTELNRRNSRIAELEQSHSDLRWEVNDITKTMLELTEDTALVNLINQLRMEAKYPAIQPNRKAVA